LTFDFYVFTRLMSKKMHQFFPFQVL